MYKGRHCIESDYYLLEINIRDFLSVIKRDNFTLKEVEKYLNTFSDYDSDIFLKLRTYLEKISLDKEKYLIRITNLLEELKSNVLVDIREHN